MATIKISLPKRMRDFIEREVASGNYNSASELLCEMVRERQKRKAEEKLEALVLEGVESGEAIAVTPEYLAKRRQVLDEKLRNRFAAG